MKKYLLIILLVTQALSSMPCHKAATLMIQSIQYSPEITYKEFAEIFDKAEAAFAKEIVRFGNVDATLMLADFIQKFYNPVSEYDYKVIQYYACKQKINSLDDISEEMVQKVVGSYIFNKSSEQLHYKFKTYIFECIQDAQFRREAFFRYLIENPKLNILYQGLLSGEKFEINYKPLTEAFLDFEIKKIKPLGESSPRKYKNQLEIIQKKINIVGPFLHIIVKYFGETFGFLL